MTRNTVTGGSEQSRGHAKIKRIQDHIYNVGVGLLGLSVADVTFLSGVTSVQPKPKIHEVPLYTGAGGIVVSVLTIVGSAVYGARKQRRLEESVKAHAEHDPDHDGSQQRADRECIKRCPVVRECMASAIAADPSLTEYPEPKTYYDVLPMFMSSEVRAARLELGRALDRMENCFGGPHRLGLPILSERICGADMMQPPTEVVQPFDDTPL